MFFFQRCDNAFRAVGITRRYACKRSSSQFNPIFFACCSSCWMCHRPANLLRTLWTSSAMGYLNRSSGNIGSSAAITTVTNRRVLTGTQRILRTIPTLLDRSASDCKSAVPNKGSAGIADAFSHFFSKSFT